MLVYGASYIRDLTVLGIAPAAPGHVLLLGTIYNIVNTGWLNSWAIMCRLPEDKNDAKELIMTIKHIFYKNMQKCIYSMENRKRQQSNIQMYDTIWEIIVSHGVCE